jgi:hypothetical protein
MKKRAAPRLAASADVDADLAALTPFAASLRHVSWFAAVGQTLTDSENREAQDYAAAIGFAQARIAPASDWRAAERATRDPKWSTAWWQAEEDARAVLMRQLDSQLDRRALLAALTHVTNEASDVVMGAASVAASRDGIANQALARVAAGAATQAAYQAAIAVAARAGAAHPFAIKFRLFAAGRWPLGIVDKALYVF